MLNSCVAHATTQVRGRDGDGAGEATVTDGLARDIIFSELIYQ